MSAGAVKILTAEAEGAIFHKTRPKSLLYHRKSKAMDSGAGKTLLSTTRREVQKERPNSLLNNQNNSRVKRLSKSHAVVDDGITVKVNVTLPTPIPVKGGGSFSIAHVAYPFKNSADGKIEQFVHTPTSPGSDPRQPKAYSLNSSPAASDDRHKLQPSKLHISSKQFDLSNLTGLKFSQKSFDSDSDKSTPVTHTQHRSGIQSAVLREHPIEDRGPLNKRTELLKMKRRPSLRDLVTKSQSSDDSAIHSLIQLERPHKPVQRRSSKTTLSSIDSLSLKWFEK